MKAFQSDECSWQAAGDGAEGRGPGFIVVRLPTPRVRFSAHALLRMAERGISRGEAEAVLIHGMEMPVRGGLAAPSGERPARCGHDHARQTTPEDRPGAA